jgi:murein DD-endopeptidase MepM/ murein hydrolase activator NlpD
LLVKLFLLCYKLGNKFKKEVPQMFFRQKEPKQRPAVKKVSELVNPKSHNQKKYISLMLVPSYSTGKTRSLRIPRVILNCFMLVLLAVCLVVWGFYLRSLHFERVARHLNNSLEETQATFNAFQEESEITQNELTDAAAQMHEQLTEEQQRVQEEIDRQERRHQETLGDIWEIIDELEIQMREFEEERLGIIENLSARYFIEPIAELLLQMEEEQNILRAEFSRGGNHKAPNETVPAIQLLSFTPKTSFSENELFSRLDSLVNELEVQRILLNNIEFFKVQMSPYLLNYPTLWPVRGNISSGFGWRRNPFGGRGSEHHNGIDIPARSGTPIRAAGGGTVTFAGWQNGYGNTIVIDHGNGITTKYAHNTRNAVSEGWRVERGDIIAYVGSTGRSTGAHLHYEVRINGAAVNPVSFLTEYF